MTWNKVQHATKKHAREFTANNWVTGFVRLGYFSRGVLYGLIGIFGLGLAIGMEKKSLNQKEVILFISRLPYGHEFLIILLVGLGGYSLWGFMRAILDYISPRNMKIPFFQRMGYLFSGFFYASLLVPTFAIIVNHPVKENKQGSLKDISHMLLQIPFGQFFLSIIGIMSCISGLVQISKAVKAKKPTDVNYHNEKVQAEPLFMTISRLGIAMRGLLWIIIGIFAMIAAVYADPSRVKETNEVLTSLMTLPLGRILVSAIGTGFILFGIYSITLSFWVALPNYEKK